ncbi:nuclease-related domain-containing DEAD/DEAH box helicase [Pontibacillus chungwhensis]|uniref:nuclease-related domain-containing DEAD/DEAH box helicase n=1 Tax=Pontibacillus chungwhensis TaxID=265426 RepID=UPI000A69F861|nr:nuclease-related domain-containing DEAD/DEAH box helicase [Pontibacillus chungwhensis]
MDVIRNSYSYDDVQHGEDFFLKQLEQAEGLEGWTVYEQPHLNGDRPDFVLCHPEKGVIIVEVKDFNLKSSSYKTPGLVKGEDGRYIDQNPVKQVKRYKDNLLQYISRQYLNAEEKYYAHSYAMIETIVYFHNATREEGEAYCQPNDYTKILGRQEALSLGNNDFRASNIATLNYSKSKFSKDGILQNFVKDLEAWMNPSDYHKDRLEPIKLYPDQQRYIKVKPGSFRRLSGVAGSGKSLILATKAAEMLKQHKRVLLLTYNITLRHYLRDLVSQQFGEGDRRLIRDHLVIKHFHDFVSGVADEHGIELPESKGDDFELVWLDKINAKLNQTSIHDDYRFDTILIDEGQDFKHQWVRFLKQFYTGNTDFYLFYDVQQDLYGRQKEVWIEDPDVIIGMGFKGSPGRLKISRRLPGSAVQMINKIREHFNDAQEEILVPSAQMDLFTTLHWENVDLIWEEKDEAIERHIQSLIDNGVHVDDIAVLTTHEKTGMLIVKTMQSKGYTLSHVYDRKGEADQSARRAEKWKFQPGNGRLKVCSIHSFKGWEASHIILALDRPARTFSSSEVSSSNNQSSETAAQLEDEVKRYLFMALSRVRYYPKMVTCSFTCLNFIEEYNGLEELFRT